MLFKIAVALAIASSPALAAIAAAPVCNADNCLRAIRATTSLGSADCQSYFLTTVTPTRSTVTETAIVTSSTTTTWLYTTTTTVANTVVSTSLIPVAKRLFQPQDLPLPDGLASRRQVVTDGPQTSTPTGIPAYASACSGAMRYSSACSCVGATRSTITASTPLTAITVTNLIQVTRKTQTNVDSTTISKTATETITTPATTTIYASPTCTRIVEPFFTYNLVYTGRKTMNPNNPGMKAGTSALTFRYAGFLSTCTAANLSAATANTSFTQFGGGYFTFNLQFHEAAQEWVCVAYYDTTPTSYYNVDDPDMTRSYGYST
ncbi:hypothetical protein BKA65DRAFT_485000 [Rhexocercosporidium sp. MPI-PUGE-AT-0058]|nr:hypothetical protein BKA65DRAFT_485000 [Rhexocercosporidium sp. MPI-PUGE-AT-0058]